MKWNKKATTRFVENLGALEVKLLNAPTLDDLLSYIPSWGTATWNDKPHNNFSPDERAQVVQDMFEGKILPSSLETVGLVFLISNIDLVDVTHLIRHRTMSFSAICTGDRDLRDDDCLVKPAIMEDRAIYDRYMKVVSDAKQLYADMVDSKMISILDARTVLPRSLEHHYYARVNLKDAINFIKQRSDRQIDPESNNIIALKMWIEIVKQYPPIKSLIDFSKPDFWYVHTAPTGRSSTCICRKIETMFLSIKLNGSCIKTNGLVCAVAKYS
jgi:thymidylate synthase (FAD)